MSDLEEFQCRTQLMTIRCSNIFYRNGLGDAFDYPFCEKCQEGIEGTITRFNDGKFQE